jgi:hypothetical protein
LKLQLLLIRRLNTQHNDTQHYIKKLSFCVYRHFAYKNVMLTVEMKNIITSSVIMLSDIMINVSMLKAIMLNGVMLNVIMLYAIMLNANHYDWCY